MCAYPLRVPNTAGKPSDALTFPWPFQARQRAKRLRLVFSAPGMSPNWPQVTGGFGPPSQLEAYERSPGPPEQLRDLQRGVISPLARYPSQGTAIWTWHTAPGQYEDNPRPPWGRGTNEFQRQRKRPTDRQTPQGRGKRSRLEEGKEQREKSQGFRAFFVGL